MGDGSTTQRTTPVDVSGLTGSVMSITAGGNHTCAPVTSGGARCWGANGSGQLGDNSLENRSTPVNALITISHSYTYGNAAHKHAVTDLSTGEHYEYDANGNMTCRTESGVTYLQIYDAENRMVSVEKLASGTCAEPGNVIATWNFIYDGDGNLVKKIEPEDVCTVYVGGVYEVEKATCGSLTVTKTTTYYPVAGAMRIQQGTDDDVYYALRDHLGSASVVTDSSGNVVGEQRYYPFGGTRWSTGSMFTDKLYTGQREMEGLGIYHYGARFYSPYLNRFTQPDSIVPNLYNPQSLNRFSYVYNNPMAYTDPSGHKCIPEDECEGYVGYGYTLHKKPPSKVDKNDLSNGAGETGYTGSQLYAWYLMLWKAPTTSWWWQVFGQDGDFSMWDAMGVIMVSESQFNWTDPNLSEAAIRAANRSCMGTDGAGSSCSTAGYINWFAAYSSSGYNLVSQMLSPHDPRRGWIQGFDSGAEQALNNFAASFVNHDSAWNTGCSDNLPCGWANNSEGMYDIKVRRHLNANQAALFTYNPSDGGLDANPWFIPSGCVVTNWIEQQNLGVSCAPVRTIP